MIIDKDVIPVAAQSQVWCFEHYTTSYDHYNDDYYFNCYFDHL